MFRDTIDGLEDVFGNDIWQSYVVVVTGGPGTLKSGFSTTVLSKHLEKHDEYGLYITLEEPVLSHVRNITSLGVNPPGNLRFLDFTDIRSRFEGENGGDVDILDMIQATVTHYKEDMGEKFTCFALDSLGVLYSLIKTRNLRARMYHFFKFLRDNELTSFIVMESPDESNIEDWSGSEQFLGDGIIEMGRLNFQNEIMLYLKVLKMRGCSHSRKRYLVEVTEKGIGLLGPDFGD